MRTVETGSFSAVAKEMDTTQPTISKQIAALEEYLDVQLLVRSTRKVSLTDEGMRFYEHCQQILAAFDEAESSVGKRQKPSGILRVNCSVAFGQMQVVPRLKRFLDRFPDIKIDLTMNDSYIDLVEEGIDLAIRIGNFLDSTTIAQPIGMTRLITVGTTSYFERTGEPQVPADLLQHNCIIYTRQATGTAWNYQFEREAIAVAVKGNLQVNDSAALREAVLAGLGIGTSPIWAFCNEIKNQTVKVVLERYEPEPLPIRAVYRRSRFQSAKVKCFIEFLVEEFSHLF
ncbi:LysR family transcriptional regulator [Tumidithrix elongata RA019]|uniref:LysR family transcriptional regulator n=1 Tax=Tumidithrix elongata BACA0141 TaxID=2716417 RepID=A0AAW9PWQ3_9CYAN|nr:LysR family transcriptional regulator [Tumidithrix elongata RA019]